MGNEIYEYKNNEDFSVTTKTRIHEFLGIMNKIIKFKSGLHTIADVCCGNKFIGNAIQSYVPTRTCDFYDYYPIDSTISKIDLNFKVESKIKYDLVIFSHSLEHFEDSGMVLNSLKTFLNASGQLIIVVPNCEYNIKARDPNLGHFKFFDFNSLKEEVNKVFTIDFIAENNQDVGFEELWIVCSNKLKR